MTGFGRGESSGDGRTWTVEVRSVNHRFLDITVKMPRQFLALEELIKKEVGSVHQRGRVEVFVGMNDAGEMTSRLQADLALAREYQHCLEEIRQDLNLVGAPDLALLASFRDIIKPVNQEEDPGFIESAWPVVRTAITAALADCRQMRLAEGLNLKNDLQARITGFSSIIAGIETAIPAIVVKRKADLQERLDNLLQGVEIDPVRLAQEVAIMADRSDVTEEVVRLKSHVGQFVDFLAMTEPVGRRCDFLLQEFLREVNTIGSKINNAQTAHQLVDLKNELEKMREQVQNLE